MNVLILKLNATGDVVRTTTLLHRLQGDITWITAPNNVVLLEGVSPNVRCVLWENRAQAPDRCYDLVISLEDEAETTAFVKESRHKCPSERRWPGCLHGRRAPLVRPQPDQCSWPAARG